MNFDHYTYSKAPNFYQFMSASASRYSDMNPNIREGVNQKAEWPASESS